jgi:hypothetical protein
MEGGEGGGADSKDHGGSFRLLRSERTEKEEPMIKKMGRDFYTVHGG